MIKDDFGDNHDPIKKTTNQLYVDLAADLNEYPPLENIELSYDQAQFTIGDLHGNALKLIYILIRHGIISLSKEDYYLLRDIYLIDTPLLTKEKITQFCDILAKANLVKHPTLRLLGDVLSDRGSNDYFTLKVLERIQKDPNSVPLEIILSNHDTDFIVNMETDKSFIAKYFNENVFAMSMRNMRWLIDSGLIDFQEIENIYKKYYCPHLSLISYTIDQENKNMTLYSHAPIGLSIINDLAKKLYCEHSLNSVDEIISSIDRINYAFAKTIKAGCFHSLLDIDGLRTSIPHINPSALPIEFCIWNREYDSLGRVKRIGEFTISYVHGHDINDDDLVQVYSLDNFFGKGERTKDSYHFLYSTENQVNLKLNSKKDFSTNDVLPSEKKGSEDEDLQERVLEQIWCQFFADFPLEEPQQPTSLNDDQAVFSNPSTA